MFFTAATQDKYSIVLPPGDGYGTQSTDVPAVMRSR